MTDFNDLTTTQLHQIVALKEQIEALQIQIASIVDGDGDVPATVLSGTKKRRMSASARAKIAAAQRARWARVKRTKVPKTQKKKDGRSSPAFRAKMAAAARARWKKAKAAGKKAL